MLRKRVARSAVGGTLPERHGSGFSKRSAQGVLLCHARCSGSARLFRWGCRRVGVVAVQRRRRPRRHVGRRRDREDVVSGVGARGTHWKGRAARIARHWWRSPVSFRTRISGGGTRNADHGKVHPSTPMASPSSSAAPKPPHWRTATSCCAFGSTRSVWPARSGHADRSVCRRRRASQDCAIPPTSHPRRSRITIRAGRSLRPIRASRRPPASRGSRSETARRRSHRSSREPC